MQTLVESISSYQFGSIRAFKNLAVVPLMVPKEPSTSPQYLLAADAFAAGVARVTECGAHGSVPELCFENLSDSPVLLLDGEELIGSKQNRVLNLTILAPARCSIKIPVSCVEAGRWRRKSAEMSSSPNVLCSRIRSRKTSQVSDSMRTTLSRSSDQRTIWKDLAEKAERMNTVSATAAMFAIYDQHAAKVDEYVNAFPWEAGQVGAAFIINNIVAGIDIFDHSATMRALSSKLLRSYAVDAIDSNEAEIVPENPMAKVSAFIESMASSRPEIAPAVGLGTDVRLEGNGITGAALWWHEQYVHTCAFAIGL